PRHWKLRRRSGFLRQLREVCANLHGRWHGRPPPGCESPVLLSSSQLNGISTVRRAPCPGFDSTVSVPPTPLVRSLIEIGPRRRRSSSSLVYRPEKLNPRPLSSITRKTFASS